MNNGENHEEVNKEQAEISFQVLSFKSMLSRLLNPFYQVSHFIKPAYA